MLSPKIAMKPMNPIAELFCMITLGFLVGWYYFLLILYPVLIYLSLYGSVSAICILLLAMILSIIPLSHKPWGAFMYSWIFTLWREYFDFTYDISHSQFNFKQKQYMCLEFAHGIFPMGQFISASIIKDAFPGQMICGTGADIIFYFPIMRHIMAWLGTRPANRKSIRKILDAGHHVAIIPGGIAEMYLASDQEEGLYLNKRQSTIKAAIEEGIDIVPTFFFGNSRLLTTVGGKGSDSWVSKLSRRLRMSVIFFYGRGYLPIPYRHPIHMVTGDVVTVVQKNGPSEEEIQEVHRRVVEAVTKLYNAHKPEWETRPLRIY